MFQTTKQNSMGYPTFRESQIQVTTPHVLGVCNYQILSIRWVNSPAGLGSCWYVMICPSTHAPRMLILSPVLQFTSPLLLKSNMSLGCIKVISHHIPPYPTMLLNLIMLVTSLSWLFSLSPATCANWAPLPGSSLATAWRRSWRGHPHLGAIVFDMDINDRFFIARLRRLVQEKQILVIWWFDISWFDLTFFNQQQHATTSNQEMSRVADPGASCLAVHHERAQQRRVATGNPWYWGWKCLPRSVTDLGFGCVENL